MYFHMDKPRTSGTSDPCIYVCGDERLGPIALPKTFPLKCEVGRDSTYRRFGGLCPGEFLANYTDAKTGEYVYPPHDGFQIDTAGNPIISSISLLAGTLVDRFGKETGEYMSPAGAPFAQRSLPPSQLNAPPGAEYPDNYHVYAVLKPIVVQAGPILPWFAQPGFGVQFLMPKPVLTLIEQRYLARVNLTRARDAKPPQTRVSETTRNLNGSAVAVLD